jgi:ZIP family zinc transporter
MALLLGFGAFCATLLGGSFALWRQDKLHLVLGFSAGAVIGVALFDLLPEATSLATPSFPETTVALFIAIGFFTYLFLNRVLLLHPEHDHGHETDRRRGALGAASLSLHSLLDGIGIGLAFKVSPAVGLIVAAAVLAHDFSDGINTVSIVLRNKGEGIRAFRWLLLDAVAPIVGVISTFYFSLDRAELGLTLALFCGFFLYLGSADLLPESHHRHPKMLTGIMNIIGALVIYIAIHFAG